MSNIQSAATVRDARRDAVRGTLVAAAWQLAGTHGLTGLTLRDLAKHAGTTTPTVYAYFDSKNAIYDAMFAAAAAEFEAEMARECEAGAGTPELLVETATRFFDFSARSVPRYLLLFQHAIPDFHPSDEAFAPAVRALQITADRLATFGVTEQSQVDLWIALLTGLMSQQIANDPGGDRWTALVDEAVSMFLAHVRAPAPSKSDSKENHRVRT